VGTTIIKIHLQVSKDEQRQRLQARLDDPTKNWKFRTDDLAVREQWDAYQQAYEEMITETSTEAAPWFVVPSDRKWVRNVAVSRLLVHHLEEMNPQYPPADPALAKVVVT
jgi:polyphosphate kinase 2 (PPK2 family)